MSKEHVRRKPRNDDISSDMSSVNLEPAIIIPKLSADDYANRFIRCCSIVSILGEHVNLVQYRYPIMPALKYFVSESSRQLAQYEIGDESVLKLLGILSIYVKILSSYENGDDYVLDQAHELLAEACVTELDEIETVRIDDSCYDYSLFEPNSSEYSTRAETIIKEFIWSVANESSPVSSFSTGKELAHELWEKFADRTRDKTHEVDSD